MVLKLTLLDYKSIQYSALRITLKIAMTIRPVERNTFATIAFGDSGGVRQACREGHDRHSGTLSPQAEQRRLHRGGGTAPAGVTGSLSGTAIAAPQHLG